MRDRDSIILESLYKSILLNENSEDQNKISPIEDIFDARSIKTQQEVPQEQNRENKQEEEYIKIAKKYNQKQIFDYFYITKYNRKDDVSHNKEFLSDIKTLEKMVNEKANNLGYTNRGSHHTDETFNHFDLKKIGKRDLGYWGTGFYFTGGWARHIDPLNRKNYRTPLWWPTGLEGKYTMNVWLKIEKPFKIHGDEIRHSAWEALKKDYDGILVVNPLYPPTSDEFIEKVVKNPNQIKSADPITYDDQDNIIPLSQRFDSSKDDIRY